MACWFHFFLLPTGLLSRLGFVFFVSGESREVGVRWIG